MKMAEEIVLKAFIVFTCFRASYTIDNSISLNTSYHNGFLMLQCQVSITGCCQEAKRIEFKKNGRGVCDLKKCTGEFAIPLSRDNTEFYRCFCPGSDLHRAHLLITETRTSDYGSWTCECTDRNNDKSCESNVLVVSETSLKEDIAPVFIHEIEVKQFSGWVVSIVIVLVIIIGVLLGILFVVRCYIARRVRIVQGNCLTSLCIGGGEEGTNSEKQDLKSSTTDKVIDMAQIWESLQDIKTSMLVIDMAQILESLKDIKTSMLSRITSSDKPVWCICSMCEERELHSEKLCCGRVKCITLHEDFQTYCFKDIDDTPSDDSEKQRKKRAQAYKNYNRWGHGVIAAKRRFIILPACCVGIIRNKFRDPNDEYSGLKKDYIFPDSEYSIISSG